MKTTVSPNKIFVLFFFFLFYLGSNPVFAETLPYFCGFETPDEVNDWTLVNGNNQNRWYINKATAFKGEYSLYISSDNGNTARYSSYSGLVAAYKEFQLLAGTYEITFDWKALGGIGDTLYVCWISDPNYIIAANTAGNFPTAISNNVVTKLHGSSGWKNQVITVRVRANAGPYRLAFYWANDNDTPFPPGACIDNVQIGSLDPTFCARPQNIVVQENQGVEISWNGSSDSYDLMYKDIRTDNWTSVYNIQGTLYTIPSLDEGAYTFWVRGKCGNDSSLWTVSNGYYIVTESARNCINFADLHSSDIEVYYGVYDAPRGAQGVIDYGEENGLSRHTVNKIPDRFDKYTGYGLRTIPENELVSVRLGNSEVKYQAESIVYNYVVDSASTIILLEYAVILEEAHLDDTSVQSKFQLEILDERGRLISDCGFFEFYPSNVNKTYWKSYTYKEPGVLLDKKILWKDWTSMGLDLESYKGENVKIRLTTYDCNEGAHFGYAYFTLNCIPKKISGLTCAENPIDTIKAPSGFNYEWYHIVDMNTILSTEQYLKIEPDDTATYICRVTSPEKPECLFELKAVVAPRYPKAMATYTLTPEDCQHKVKFKNESFVYTENGGIDDPVESFLWDFGVLGTSTEKDPVVMFGQTGEYPVKLTVGLNNGLCEDEWLDTLRLQPLQNVFDTIPVSICEGDYYLYNNIPLVSPKKYTYKYKTYAGCDSVVTIDLSVNPKFETTITDTVCFGESYLFYGQECKTTGLYKHSLQTIYGCDSTITLNLTVLPEIKYTVSTTPEVSGNDGSIILSNLPADYTHYELDGVVNAPLTGLASGEYELTVFTQQGTRVCSKSEAIVIETECPELTIEDWSYSLCGDDSSPAVEVVYILTRGKVKKYNVDFDAAAKEKAGFVPVFGVEATSQNTFVIPLPNVTEGYIRPGYYTAYIDYSDEFCNSETLIITFTILYPDSIITQRWNDILSVRNSLYNGGYEFSAYQWYKDGVAIPGATKSYLYVPEGLDFEATYTVNLVQQGETEAIMSCEFTPRYISGPITIYPTAVKRNMQQTVEVPTGGTISIFDVMGVKLGDYNLEEGKNTIKSPNQTGIYLYQIRLKDGDERTYRISVSE